MEPDSITYMAVRVSGPYVTHEDASELRRDLEEFPNVRVSEAWEPAAVPDAVIQVSLGFFALRLVEFLLSKGFESIWAKLGKSWRRYRDSRRGRGLREPVFNQLVLQAADCEVVLVAPLEPGSPLLVEAMQVLQLRLTSGLLAQESIERIELPCRVGFEGGWETVLLDEQPDELNYYIWHVMSRDVNGHYGYYDARADAWIDQTMH